MGKGRSGGAVVVDSKLGQSGVGIDPAADSLGERNELFIEEFELQFDRLPAGHELRHVLIDRVDVEAADLSAFVE